jgi:glycerol-3-phosphate dehydrogenase
VTDKPATGRPGPFSAATRAEAWRRVGETSYDLLVVGGGITGVGVARDAVRRGLRVALVEAGDFAQGTSSRSSRLIHGGLRYLETFHFKLVFEALAERRRLVALAPHLVRPLPFLYPVFSGADVGMLKLTAGMWAYDALALFQNIQTHSILGRGAVLAREPGLRGAGLHGAALYYDAQVDDARLTLAVARGAHEAGAVLLPHARVTGFLRGLEGQVEGVHLRDERTGSTADVRARLVVGAAGPWTDELRRLLDAAAAPRLRPTKGVHLQLRREDVGNRGAITLRSPIDQRTMFVLPWGQFSYVGTTDTDYAAPAGEAEADRGDVDYLLASLAAVFPRARATREAVVSSWAGVRPLVAPEGQLSAGQTSREHEIWREPVGPLFVAGGKLTTFRVMAAETAAEAAAILAREHGVAGRPFDSALLRIPGAPAGEWRAFVASATARALGAGLSRDAALRLVSTYGTDVDSLLELIAGDAALALPILPPHPYLWAEVVHAVRSEMALGVEDVLRRRLHLFYDAPDGGVGVAERVARRMAAEEGIGWSEEEIRAEVARYAAAVERARGALAPPRAG